MKGNNVVTVNFRKFSPSNKSDHITGKRDQRDHQLHRNIIY